MADVSIERRSVFSSTMTDPEVKIWTGDDHRALVDWYDFDGTQLDPQPPATFECSEDEMNALVVEWLRGPIGHPGPMGPRG